MSVDLSVVEEFVVPIAESYGVFLHDVYEATERGRRIVRVTIDVPGLSKEGHCVTIEQCAGVSRDLSEVLDLEEAIDGVYNLEVSSPGVERVLSKPRHFLLAVGEYVRVSLVADFNGRKEFLGVLLCGEAESIRVAIRPKKKNLKKGQIEKLPPVETWEVADLTIAQIQKAQTVYEL